MMTTDRQRLETLKQGLAPAGEKGFVAINAQDLRWLIQLAESQPQPFVILDQTEEEEEDE
jgi:hypothetical protein